MPDPNRTADHQPDTPLDDDPAATTDLSRQDSSTNPNQTGAYLPDSRSHSTPASIGTPVSVIPSIPGYEIDSELGRGGMGVVYKARQTELNRPVAIKMILGGKYTDPVAQARFLVEAEVIARLTDPRIVQVYEFGRHDDQPFFVLEFIGGGSLAGRLRSGKPTPRDAAALVAELAEAMAAAHEKGVVHRDLKPANVLLTETGEPKITDFGLAKIGESDMTASGAIMGTPSYMSPEQAAGRTKEVGTPTDVYALGVILYELLTGRVPFRGDSVMETIQQVMAREPERPRLRDASIPRDLETICLKCLEKQPGKRYGTAAELATDLRAYLDGRPISARPVGVGERTWKWVNRYPGRAAATAAAVLVLVGAGIAANEVSKQREVDRIAAEKQLAEATRQKERETRASALVDSLSGAETPMVSRIVADLSELRELARPKLVELAAKPVATKPGLHARLALLADEPQRAAELAAYLPMCKPDELLTIRDALKPQAEAVAPGLWAVLSGKKAEAGKRVRAAGALAGLAPNDTRWAAMVAPVADAVVQANPVEFVAWSAALEPIRSVLIPKLLARYPAERERIRGGKLDESALAAAISGYDLTANLLARYAADRPADLAELVLVADPRHYRLFSGALAENKAGVLPILKAELARRAAPRWAVDGGGVGLAAAAGCAVAVDALDPDPVIQTEEKQRGHAAAVLLALGEAESVWPVFRFPADGDPTARSYLLARLTAIEADPLSLMRRFDMEPDVSAKRALLIALGDFPLEVVPESERETLAGKLLVLYQDHPDPGLHGAIDWLLGEKWGKANKLSAIDTEQANAARARVAAQQLADVGPLPLGLLLPAPAVAMRKDWYVNVEGQTYAVVRGSAEFTLGSPATEPGRTPTNEPPHRKRIGRTYAIATKEVTLAEFLRFRPKHNWNKRFTIEPDTPAMSVTWYQAAEYCNWLSAREGIPPDQWCYEPNKAGAYAEGMQMKPGHLKLSGYRLPTEAEWECACRGGTVTSRPYGRGEELLPRYGWSRTQEDRAWPVGGLRPTDNGLFDVLGNALEWCEDPTVNYLTGQKADLENRVYAAIDERMSRRLRGGSFGNRPLIVRSAFRFSDRPGNGGINFGFRPARTLSD